MSLHGAAPLERIAHAHLPQQVDDGFYGGGIERIQPQRGLRAQMPAELPVVGGVCAVIAHIYAARRCIEIIGIEAGAQRRRDVDLVPTKDLPVIIIAVCAVDGAED